ncbi:hypothetical protein LGK95_15910 [Clostridium algoriphilum]|uniref:hypothetical protein n=1 Tax=Clostridium algoriphilum TaxID=198347 RepID=UPI001CF31C3B|nr:hypothetical protein [Clostridium algoriphilum]MCB2294972.1 hypothetical protein [Clostridium algoriphilum]
MPHNNYINYNEERDKLQKSNAIEALNKIAESHSIRDLLLEKRTDATSLENVSKVRLKQDSTEDNSDGSYKIANFL